MHTWVHGEPLHKLTVAVGRCLQEDNYATSSAAVDCMDAGRGRYVTAVY